MKTQVTRSPQQVLDEFRRKGISIGTWAKQNGFNRATVSQVLSGRNAASIGVGHRIAVMIGIKHGEIIDENCHD